MTVTSHGFRLRPVEELLDAMSGGGLQRVRGEKLTARRNAGSVVVGEI